MSLARPNTIEWYRSREKKSRWFGLVSLRLRSEPRCGFEVQNNTHCGVFQGAQVDEHCSRHEPPCLSEDITIRCLEPGTGRGSNAIRATI